MNEAIKHTPGPWAVGGVKHLVVGDSPRRVIASADMHPQYEVCEANARLIAAAPDLLTALKRLRDDVQAAHVGADERCNDCAVCWSLKMADAAIAKAEGGHQ